MILHSEASRRHRFDAFQTFIEFKYIATPAAEEMVMMALVRTFVTWWLAGNLHGNHLAILRKGFEGTIDCRQPNAGRVFESELLNLRCRQRICLRGQYALNRPFLSRASDHSPTLRSQRPEINGAFPRIEADAIGLQPVDSTVFDG